MAIVDWPELLKPLSGSIPRLEMLGTTGGTSITGQTRYIKSPAERWRYRFRAKLWSRNEHLTWRAISAICDGPVGLVRVPFSDCHFSLYSSTGGPSSSFITGSAPHSDDSPHDDLTPYAQGGIDGVMISEGAIGSTSLTVALSVAVAPQPGQYFSDGNRAYVIKSAALVSGSTYALTFGPRLRSRIPVGYIINFDRISCLMRLASEDMMDVEKQVMRYGVVELDFVEALL